LETRVIIQEGRKHQQEQKPPIPTRIKVITRYYQHCILTGFAFIKNKPIEHKYDGQKNRKGERVKKHS
jgi:hypothetical protein